MGPSKEGTAVYPSVQGATNWYAPSYSPRTELFYLTVWDDYWGLFYADEPVFTPGNFFLGGLVKRILPNRMSEEDVGYGAVRALDPRTGELKWEFKTTEMSESGLLSTAGDVLFSGSFEGNFVALDAYTGKQLWRKSLGGRVTNSTITYLADGKQYVSVVAGHSLFTFGLKE